MVKIKVALLILLGVVHLVVTFVAVVPGYLSIDEAVYHWMCVSFDKLGGLALWNGYEEFPSPELRHPYFTIHDGRLFTPFPYLFPTLAWPFYKISGYWGLFLCNSLSFVCVVGLSFLIARKLFQDVNLALNSCFILILATFTWEYSQAAWPHMVALLFTTAAFHFFVHAYWPKTRRTGWIGGIAAGLVAGFSSGIRIDTVLTFPALVLPFLFARPWRPVDAIMVAVGAIPGLAVSAVCNYVKFGQLNPFCYGQYQPNAEAYASLHDLMAPAVLVLGIAWLTTRSSSAHFVRENKNKLLVLGCVMGVVAVSAYPQIVDSFRTTLGNAWISLVDMTALEPGVVFPPMGRTPGGAVAHMGALKKALLQSMPFLVLLVVPIAAIVRREAESAALIVLLLTPLIVVGYTTYSFLQFEAGGGLSLNLRYALPCMPFFSILCAYAVRDLQRWWGIPNNTGIVAACIITTGVFFLCTRTWIQHQDTFEFPILVFPLLIAGLLCCFLFGGMIGNLKIFYLLRMTAWTVVAVAITWSGLVSILYDYPYHRHWRSLNNEFSAKLLKVIPGDSLFFAGHGFFTTSVKLVEKGEVRIAYPAVDEYQDLPRLSAFHLNKGRRVFGAFPKDIWMQLRSGTLRQYQIKPLLIADTFLVSEIVAGGHGEPPAR